MRITKNYITKQFKILNKRFFDNTLILPQFQITNTKQLGCLKYCRDKENNLMYAKICISQLFDRSEKEVLNTLAHEMIHLYIRQNNIQDTKPHHGKVFYSYAEKINSQGGFNISATNTLKGCRLKTKRQFYVGCFIDRRNNQAHNFVLNKNSIDYFKNEIKAYPSVFKDFFVFKTNDDKTYATMNECRKRIMTRKITHKQFKALKRRKNIIYSRA